MIITKMALPRRTFLHGIGAALALPLLDAMVPALSAMAATAQPVRRLGYIYIPHGAPMATWMPPGEGTLSELSPALSPLAAFRDQMVVLTNLELKQAQGPGGNHALSNATFLSATRGKRTDGTDYVLATTVDQIAAKAIGQDTALPSLELALDLNYLAGTCDNGYSCTYMNTLSWSSPTTPLPTEANPRVVFGRLFGDGGTASERLAEVRRNRSILDWVNEDMSRLQRRLGPTDRIKVSEYLDSIREVERRIQRAERQSASEGQTNDLNRPLDAPASWEEHAKLMFDLQVLALQADITRVITFQLARETSTRSFPSIGVPDAWHPTSHHQKDPEKLAKLAKINTYHCSLLAYFLERLRATRDGEGTLLDHSMYVYGSGMGDSDQHDHRNVPMLVVGGGAGTLRGGRHIKYAEPTPMANLHLSLLDKVGVHLDRFGDSTGRIAELVEPLSI
jgi:Protein of unknown function (DUF1552)